VIFFLFWLMRYTKFATHPTSIATEKPSRTFVASSYRGGTESCPRSQVAKMPPLLVMMNAIAMEVALRVCGAVLLAFQVVNVGALRYTPGMEKNSETY
jgi:hypothetical protein